MKESGRFKKKRIKFSMVSNEPLESNTLSLAAKGLYSLIQRYITIEKKEDGSDFVLYKFMLEEKCKEGKTAFDTAWKELLDAGYLKKDKKQTHNGFIYEYELVERLKKIRKKRKSPTDTKPIPGDSKSGKPKAEKPRSRKKVSINNNEHINTDSNNTNIINTDSGDVVVSDRNLEDKVYCAVLTKEEYISDITSKEFKKYAECASSRMIAMAKQLKPHEKKKFLDCSDETIFKIYQDSFNAMYNVYNSFKNPDGYVKSKIKENLML